MAALSKLSRMVAVAMISFSMVGAARALEPAEGPVLLTVHGAISETNRGALDPFHDALLSFQDASFEAAAVFDRAMLSSLEGRAITTDSPGWPGAFTFEGPSLRAVLDAVGASGSEVVISAADGYAVTLPMTEVERFEPMLALSRDGAALALGGRGPIWLVYPRAEHPELMAEEDDARWVWAVVRIEVR